MKAFNEEWISKKHNEDIGYQAVEPLDLLKLLRSAGGDLNNLEITELNTNMLEQWGGVEAPVMMFALADKYERQLERHTIPKQPELWLSFAVSINQTSGQFDAPMREWHARLLASKSFSIRTCEIVDNGAYFNRLPMPPRLDHIQTFYVDSLRTYFSKVCT